MIYHEPDLPLVREANGNRWEIHRIGKSWFARFCKYNSDTGPFSTVEQADDFIHLRNQ